VHPEVQTTDRIYPHAQRREKEAAKGYARNQELRLIIAIAACYGAPRRNANASDWRSRSFLATERSPSRVRRLNPTLKHRQSLTQSADDSVPFREGIDLALFGGKLLVLYL
jgi:hypothetical protein